MIKYKKRIQLTICNKEDILLLNVYYSKCKNETKLHLKKNEKRRKEIHKRKESEGGRDCCKLVETHDGRLKHHNNPLVFISLTLPPFSIHWYGNGNRRFIAWRNERAR